MGRDIRVDVEVNSGNPCLEGTRLTVFDVVLLCHSEGLQAVLHRWRGLTDSDVTRALTFCATLECDLVQAHCGGCTKRSLQDGVTSWEDYVRRFEKVVFSESRVVLRGAGTGTAAHLGRPESVAKHEWFGVDAWQLASEALGHRAVSSTVPSTVNATTCQSKNRDF
jgi:uncharacterized protein (DUF433 family)